MTRKTVFACAMACVLGSASATWALDPADAGLYLGQWNNTTAGTSGAVSFDFSVDGSVVTAEIDLDGNVFGLANPDPFVFSGPLAGDGSFSLSETGNPTFGDIQFDVAADGTIAGSITNLPGAAGSFINRVELTGTAGGGEIDMIYQIFTAPSIVGFNGTVDATLIPEPATLSLLAFGTPVLLRRRRR